jgi:hypothetical protein
MMQPEHLGEGSHSAESGRYGHVQLRRHHVRKFVQREGGRVTEDALWLTVAVPRPELPDHEVRSRGRWKLRQSVDAARLAYPVAGPDLIRVDAVRIAGLPSLAGRKESALWQCGVVQFSLCSDIARHAIKPQMILGSIAYIAISVGDLSLAVTASQDDLPRCARS